MDIERLKALTAKLERLPTVSRLALENEPGSARVAYAIVEIEEAARKIADILVPAIDAETNLDVLQDALLELELELRHLVYHINDCGLFGDLSNSA